MDIAIDASAIIAVIINEPVKPILLHLTQDANLIGPSSIHWEIGNAFSAMLKRQRITLNETLRAIKAYHRIPIRFVDVDLDVTLQIAAEMNIYAYDAYLIRCASRYNVPLLTLDQGLSYAATHYGIDVLEVKA
jgi:predicted nucleic acid-binding protein